MNWLRIKCAGGVHLGNFNDPVFFHETYNNHRLIEYLKLLCERSVSVCRTHTFYQYTHTFHKKRDKPLFFPGQK